MIDLHMHTTASDGSETPQAVVRMATEKGLSAIAITDHDTLEGYFAARGSAAQAGLELVCGVELSTRLPAPPSGERLPSVHLLAYFVDCDPPEDFCRWLEGHQASRRKRNLLLVDRLNALGVRITLEEVQAIGGSMTGRPHFARILKQHGYVETLQEAFDRYLADDASASVPRDEPGLDEAIARVADSGGLASLAHPIRLPDYPEEAALSEFLARQSAAGLRGLEVYYSDHTPQDVERLLALAARHDLIPTGGSDFHGSNKPGIEIGSGRGNLAIPDSVLAAIRSSRRRERTAVS